MRIVNTIKPDLSKNPDSRYRRLLRLEGESGRVFLETQNPVRVRSTQNDIVHRVRVGEENRLDLIAHQYYGNPTLWWVIAYRNNIYDPFNVPSETNLAIPSKEAVYGYGGLLY